MSRGSAFGALLRRTPASADRAATPRDAVAAPANAAAEPSQPLAFAGGRDLRLDLFRGLALWLIFLDHIPENIVNWFTLRNYGFSDATEIFIFISGYTAAFVYGRAMRERGFIVSSARILRRAWQIYVAHIFLFTMFMAEIAYVTSTFSNPLYAEEMNVLGFLKNPDVAIFQAMLLKFRPVNMDVLPLYIVLLLLFPPVLRILLWQPAYALIGAAAVYVLALHYHINLPAYPNGEWFFNPFAWQLLFVFGAWCAVGGAQRLRGLLQSRIVFAVAIAYLAFALFITLTWHFDALKPLVPNWLAEVLYPIDKTNLDVLRFAHFLALAAVTVRFVPLDWPVLKWRVLQPAIRCGQHSLEIFCLGVFLAFAAQFVISEWSGGPLLQATMSAAGILIMIATANLISWYRSVEGRSQQHDQKAAPGNHAGGGA